MAEKKSASKRNGSSKSVSAKSSRLKKVTTVEAMALPANGTESSFSSEDIAQRAYALWEGRGRPMGSPEEDWHRAIEQLRSEAA